MQEWLGAYLDGELRGARLHRVEAHLEECAACRAELAALRDLSAALQTAPGAGPINAERFAAQVGLQLPQERNAPPARRALEVGWWMIPVSLLTVWLLLSLGAGVSELIAAAQDYGLFQHAPGWLLLDVAPDAPWSATLGQIGVLSGGILAQAAETEALLREVYGRLAWQAGIGLMYLAWFAIWWARQTRGGNGQPVAGLGSPRSVQNG
jgi:anti-sigma factor RsiW